jgi:hypothetical protein
MRHRVGNTNPPNPPIFSAGFCLPTNYFSHFVITLKSLFQLSLSSVAARPDMDYSGMVLTG